MNEVNFNIKHAYGSGAINDAALMIRKQVFVTEQGVPLDIEIDDLDSQTTHYVGFLNETPVVTARIAENEAHTNWHVQRVATVKEARGNGYAGKLLKKIITDAQQANIQSLDLGAQVQAMVFYEKLGFTATGPVFQEANIDHRRMIFKTDFTS
ncbi:GNAT family N-acetyltransferase [Weissella hellenica]|nr:GNAT family N-acetyltransferase [Weissella hellenica]